MNKDELREKRNRTIESLNDIKSILGLDELYIDELEKELANAKKVQVVEHFEAYGQCRDSRKITKLEQENAKLRKKCQDRCDECWEEHIKLTKAKEIIREYSKCECEYCDYKRNPDYVTMHCSQCQKYTLHKRAEQFLSEVEK